MTLRWCSIYVLEITLFMLVVCLDHWLLLLLWPWERWKRIVMSTSVCVSVCLSLRSRICPNQTGDLYQFLCMLPMAVAWSSSGGVTKFQGKWAILGVFIPIDNALLYRIAVGTHTKTAEPIEMPFGLMTWVGPRYHVLDVGPDLPRGRGNFWGKA